MHRIATSQLTTTMVWRVTVLFISFSACFLLHSVLQCFQRERFQCIHLSERLLRALRTQMPPERDGCYASQGRASGCNSPCCTLTRSAIQARICSRELGKLNL